MPLFKTASPDAKDRLAKQSKGYRDRQVYRDYLSQLTSDGMLWGIEPEEDESLRKLKVNVRRAPNELNINVGYGETVEGTLLVWAETPSEKRGRRRPRKSPEA